MTDPTDERPFSYVKHLRETRDRTGKEREHMTLDEIAQWRQSREYQSPKLRRLMSRARPPKPPRSKHGTARALGLMPYPKYRPSGVEWLGEVPEHWEVAALRRITASIRASNVDKHIRNNEIPVKLCNYVDVYHNDCIDSQINFVPGTATDRQIKHFQLLVGDVLITKDSEVATDIGVPSLVVERVPDLVAGYHLTLIRPNVQRLVGPYLFRALQSDVASIQFTHGAQGVTRYGLTYASIKSVRLPVPPLSEQRAIAKYLDRETIKIDALIAKKETLVERLEEHRTVLTSRTVTRGLPPNEARKAGLDPHPKLKPSGVEWLGEVPEHWEVAALRRITASIRASNVDKHIRNNEIPVKLCNYVDVYHNDCIDSQINFVPGTATDRQIKHFQLLVGDVLITKDSEVATDIGVPSLVVERVPDLVAGYHLTLIRPNVQRLVGPYLFRALQSDVASIQFTHGAQGVTRYGLTYASIKSVRLPVPPLSEQRAIAKYLDRETTKIDRAAHLARQEINLLREYQTRLISDVVTGNVDVRGIGSVDPEPDSRSPEGQPSHQPGFSTPPRVGKQSPEHNRGRIP